jgi:hypothetical protein
MEVSPLPPVLAAPPMAASPVVVGPAPPTLVTLLLPPAPVSPALVVVALLLPAVPVPPPTLVPPSTLVVAVAAFAAAVWAPLEPDGPSELVSSLEQPVAPTIAAQATAARTKIGIGRRSLRLVSDFSIGTPKVVPRRPFNGCYTGGGTPSLGSAP